MMYVHTIRHEELMWRYWAAKEMAIKIITDNAKEITGGYRCYHIPYRYLSQTLKKEWFR